MNDRYLFTLQLIFEIYSFLPVKYRQMIVGLIAMGYKAEKHIYVFFSLSRSNGYRYYHNMIIKQNLVLCINDIYVHVSLKRWNHIASDWSNKFIWYLRKTYLYRIKPHSILIPSRSVQKVCLLQQFFFCSHWSFGSANVTFKHKSYKKMIVIYEATNKWY